VPKKLRTLTACEKNSLQCVARERERGSWRESVGEGWCGFSSGFGSPNLSVPTLTEDLPDRSALALHLENPALDTREFSSQERLVMVRDRAQRHRDRAQRERVNNFTSYARKFSRRRQKKVKRSENQSNVTILKLIIFLLLNIN
jgi:hypothetical protein